MTTTTMTTAMYDDVTTIVDPTTMSPGNITDEVHRLMAVVKNLTNWQWKLIENYELEGQFCMLNFWKAPAPEGPFCNASWDGDLCWPATKANLTVTQRCPDSGVNDTDVTARRTCNNYGEWTDSTVCWFYDADDVWKAMIMRDIYFYGSILSFIMLTVTLVIFCCFKSLQCNRISIHKNLVVSFIIRSVVHIAYFEPFVTARENSYRDINWLCKVLTCFLYYSVVSNIFWMFVEGLFLHNRVAVSVFNNHAPFRLFYLIGWCIPAVIVVIWATCMEVFNPKKCWMDSYSSPFKWIILVPVLLTLLVNLVFLVNIIRILITKLRANNTVELDQVRKAVKATVILFPLLGITHMIFLFNPEDFDESLEMAYRVINAIFQALQGVFVSFLYCFMNTEVRIAIRKRWQRYQSQRMGAQADRRRSSTLRSSSIMTPLNGGTDDKSRRSGVKKDRKHHIKPMDEYSVTWEEDFSTTNPVA